LNRDGGTVNFRVRVINGKVILDVKRLVYFGDLWSIRSGDLLILKLENDSVIQAASIESSVGCFGCGAVGLDGSKAPGTYSHYYLSDSFINQVLHEQVVKIRMYTSDGYVEEEIIPKRRIVFQNTFKLLWPRGK